MGAAVPVAEPQWSGAHKGLALFLARLLAPLGDRPLAAPADARRPDGMLVCTLPPDALQVMYLLIWNLLLSSAAAACARQPAAPIPAIERLARRAAAEDRSTFLCQ